mmetsp:Transcript_11377/g.29570  ORF Transcript_11377/g.29570 Transcript_11377/m.29570 type:complete len:239 (+) Transcript_11377:314-1030(+)
MHRSSSSRIRSASSLPRRCPVTAFPPSSREVPPSSRDTTLAGCDTGAAVALSAPPPPPSWPPRASLPTRDLEKTGCELRAGSMGEVWSGPPLHELLAHSDAAPRPLWMLSSSKKYSSARPCAPLARGDTELAPMPLLAGLLQPILCLSTDADIPNEGGRDRGLGFHDARRCNATGRGGTSGDTRSSLFWPSVDSTATAVGRSAEVVRSGSPQNFFQVPPQGRESAIPLQGREGRTLRW